MSLSLSSSAALAPRCFARRTRARASRGRVAARVTARRAEDRRNPGAAPKPRIAVGVRHSMRVTRLRDLVEISPDLWAPSDPEHSEEPSHGLDERTAEELRADGAAQAKIFKELLLASQHFRLYTHVNQTAGCGVRFLMGSPRMEGLDDVARVTRSVCESLIEDEALEVSLVPESGMLMAEIVFPLPKAGSNEGATPRIRETERVTALVRFLEEKIVHESVVCAMEKGSDDRSTFHGEQRLNKYFTGMYARPADLLHRGTCTSSSPTEGALEASKHMVRRLWDGEEHADVELMDEVRDRVEHLFCGGNGRMVIHPSGTDAETMPLLQAVLESRAIARDVPSSDRPARYASEPERGNVVSLVACAGEVGSGTTEAAMGRFFSKSVPLGGNRVAMGQELRCCTTPPTWTRWSSSRARRPRRHGRQRARGLRRARDARGEKGARGGPRVRRRAAHGGGSKTGLRFLRPPSPPSSWTRRRARVRAGRVPDAPPPVLDPALARRAGPGADDLLEVLRRALVRVRRLLPARRRGPRERAPGGGAAGDARRARRGVRVVPHAPRHRGRLPQATHDAMPPGFCNVGVLLRWAAGLHEMETLQDAAERAGGLEVAEQKVRDWVFAMRAAALEFGPHMEYVPAIDYEGDWQLGGVNTIVPCALRSEPDGPCLSTGDLKKVYALMTADISEFLAPESTMAERRVASQKCLTGQPVDIPGGSVLRTVLGAAQLKDLISGKQSLESMLEDDKVLLAKLALIARQYDYLLSHTL